MEFFNKKEEVIEIVLTEKGKELLSKGQFNPFYYSFHDTDIIYDDASGEEQNEIVPRIKNTPTLKSIGSIKQYKSPTAELLFGENKQKFVLKNEIGSKTFGDQYAPAWNIKFLKTPPFQWYGTSRYNVLDNKKYQMTFSSSIDSDKSAQELIPQFNIQTLYQVCDIDDFSKNKFSIKFPVQDFSKQNVKLYLASLFGSISKLGIPFFKTEEISILGIKIKVYNIYNKFLNDNFLYPVATFNSAFDDFYNNSILILTKFLNETFSFQAQTVDEVVQILKTGFETDYVYSFDEIKNLVKQIENLNLIFNSFKANTTTGIEVEFYDMFEKPFKLFTPKYNILKSMWLIKDPKILIDVQELNAYEVNESSKYEINYYLVSNNGFINKSLTKNEIKEYLNISFDLAADFEESRRAKNIYDINIADESTC